MVRGRLHLPAGRPLHELAVDVDLSDVIAITEVRGYLV